VTPALVAAAVAAAVAVVAATITALWRRDRRMRARGRAAFLAVVADDQRVAALEEQLRLPAREQIPTLDTLDQGEHGEQPLT
jgi:hypothetical protein